jgi:LuxR family transcriptional regulator, regulator of acetate metabolism
VTAVTEKAQDRASLPEETARLKAQADDALAGLRVPEALLRRVEELSSRVRECLRENGRGGGPTTAELGTALLDLGELRDALGEHAASLRLEQQLRMRAGLRRLAALRTPAELIDAVPEELCRSCGFTRAMISRVRGSLWVPDILYVTPGVDPLEDHFQDFVSTAEIPLSHMVLESELVRRRAAVLVLDPETDPRMHKAIVQAARSPSYVATPITSNGRVIGFLHADRYGEERGVDLIDRDNLGEFGDQFGLVFERAALLDRMSTQREQLHRAFSDAEDLLAELAGAAIVLDEHVAPEEPPELPQLGDGATASRVEALLTAREREVLALMARGARNQQIAQHLVISEGTVKSHVKNILRKLHATSRAEAVARYIRLSSRPRTAARP